MKFNNTATARAIVLICAAALGMSCDGSSGKPAPKQETATYLSIIPATGKQVLEAVHSADAQAVLLNVWATFCIPCVEEFPDLIRLHKTYKDQGLKLILVSGDFEDQRSSVETFLTRQGVDFATYLKAGKDMAFINTLDSRWSGALPASWIYDANGVKRHFWEGKASYETLEKRVLSVLNK